MKWFKVVIFITVLVFLILFISATDFKRVQASLAHVGYRFIYIILITCLAYLAATVAWKFCMGKKGRNLTITNLFFVRHIGETASLVNPTGIVGGEAVKVFLLRDKGLGQQDVLMSVLTSRLIMVLTQLLMFTLAFTFLIVSAGSFLPGFTWRSTVYTLSAISLLYLLWCLLLGFGIIDKITAFKPAAGLVKFIRRLNQYIADWWKAFTDFFKNNPRGFAMAVLFCMLHWFLGSIEFYFILLFLGIKTTIIKALLVDMGVIFFKTAGAFIPGQVGIEEYGNKVMLAAVGIADNEIWITASILRRARQLFWIAFGFIAYLLLGKSVAGLKLNVSKEKRVPVKD